MALVPRATIIKYLREEIGEDIEVVAILFCHVDFPAEDIHADLVILQQGSQACAESLVLRLLVTDDNGNLRYVKDVLAAPRRLAGGG